MARPALTHTLIEDAQYLVVVTETDLQSGICTEGYVSKDDTQSDGYKQQRLKVLLDGKPDEEGAYRYHDEVSHRCIGKCCIGEELMEVLYDKLSEIHNCLSNCEENGTFHDCLALLHGDGSHCSVVL